MAFYGHAYITFTSLAFQVLRAMRASCIRPHTVRPCHNSQITQPSTTKYVDIGTAVYWFPPSSLICCRTCGICLLIVTEYVSQVRKW